MKITHVFCFLHSSFFILHSSYAQTLIDVTTLHTNVAVTSGAQITIPGVVTNGTYTASNSAYITQGDSTAVIGSKVNSNFNYLTDQIATLQQIPNYINMTVAANLAQLATNLGSISNSFVAVSNNLATVSNRVAGVQSFDGIPTDAHGNSRWGTNGLNLVYVPSLYSGINDNGINDGTFPSTGLNGFVLENSAQTPVDFAWAALDDNGGSFYTATRLETRAGFVLTGGAKELQFGYSGVYIGGFGFLPNLLLGDNYATSTLGFSVGEGNAPTEPPANGLHVVGNVQFDSSFSSDAHQFYSDGSGNVTCVNLTQTSDLNAKTNLVPLDPAEILLKLTTLPVYRWNFRDFTTTNVVRTHGAIAIAGNGFTNRPALATNLTASVSYHRLGGATHFGPMAQDWSSRFGGSTNGISVIDMQGVLLAGVQALANPARTETVAGTIYPSNAWNLAAITNAMPNFSIWTGNSNGQALVTLSLSNGVVHYLQVLR